MFLHQERGGWEGCVNKKAIGLNREFKYCGFSLAELLLGQEKPFLHPIGCDQVVSWCKVPPSLRLIGGKVLALPLLASHFGQVSLD